MKLDKLIRALWAFLLSFGLSIAATMGITSAFGFQIDTGLLVWCCGIFAFLGSICYTLPLQLVPLGFQAAGIAYLLSQNLLTASLKALLNRLSRAYNMAYGWRVLTFGAVTPEDMEPTIVFVLCIFGSIIALFTAWAICRKRSALPGLLTGILTVIPCFIVNDMVPATGWLYLLFLCFLVIILTASVQKKDTREGNRLYLITATATALALLILFAAVPRDTYHRQNQAEKLAENFRNAELVQLFLGHTESGADPTADGKTVDLTTVGYRVETHIQTLEVTAPFTGTLYLRGRAMDVYDGVTWTASENYYNSLTWPGYHLDKVGEVQISTRFAHNMLYVPYYANITDMRNVTLGIENEKKLTDYSFTCRQLPEGNYLSQLRYGNFSPLYEYIQLDYDVERWATPLARKLCASTKNPYEMAQRIASYVRNSATYSTRTPRMPASKKDFAQWFLEDSDTGYCVHFATSATVLLQAAGIPARYVTGYMVQVTEGEPVTVYADQAHAWAEYWLPGFGWAILDATPGDYSATPAVTETTQPQREPTATTETQPEDDLSTMQPSLSPTGGVDAPTTPQKEQESEPKISLSAILLTLLQIFLWAAGIVSVPLAVIGQRQLRFNRKQKKLAAASGNEKALLYWQQVNLYCRILKDEPDAILFQLAQKAKFSQHTLTEEELQQFEAQLAVYKAQLTQKNFLLRLYYRYLLVIL